MCSAGLKISSTGKECGWLSATESGYNTSQIRSAQRSRRSSALPSRHVSPQKHARIYEMGRQKLLLDSLSSNLLLPIKPSMGSVVHQNCHTNLAFSKLNASYNFLQRMDWNSKEQFDIALNECVQKHAQEVSINSSQFSLAENVTVMIDLALERSTDSFSDNGTEPTSDCCFSSANSLCQTRKPSNLPTTCDCEEFQFQSNYTTSKPMQVHVRFERPRQQDAVYNVRYKTQPCIHYQRKRVCPAADNCHFAHGPGELRMTSNHPKFRSKDCTNFIKDGFCPFGIRCHFRHIKV